MSDIWQALHSIAAFDGAGNPDGDARINLVEALNFSDPHATDSGLGAVFIRDLDPVDGMDDYWQEKYGITSAQKLDDPDGDGRKNIEESIVGSHPFQPDEPWQRHGDAPLPQGPESMTITLAQTAPGLRYQLQFSNDMMTWQNATGFTNPFWGTGDAFSETLSTGGAIRQFYRFVMDEPDTDGDDLSDWAELQLGTSPTSQDSDGDGWPDADEVFAQTDPNDAASNAQALNDEDGLESGLSELPVLIASQSKSITAWYAGGQGTLSGWKTGVGSFSYPHDGSLADWLMRTGGYPAFQPENWDLGGGMDLWGYSDMTETISGPNAGVYRSILHSRFALYSTQPQPWDVSRKYWKIKRRFYLDLSTPTVRENGGFIELTIPKDHQMSAVELLEPGLVNGQVNFTYLLPVDLKPDNPMALGMDNTMDPPWIMVPADGAQTLKLPGLLTALGDQQSTEVFFYKANGEGVTPVVHSGIWDGYEYTDDSGTFQVQGVVTPEAATAVIQVGYGDNGAYESEPVALISTMPANTLKVTVHPITLLSSTGTTLAAPQQLPTAAFLKQKLEDVYKQQANVSVEVTISPGASLNWDVGIGNGGGPKGKGNGLLDVCFLGAGTKYFSDEETAIRSQALDTAAHVNVYWMAFPAPDHFYAGVRLYDHVNLPTTNPDLGRTRHWFLNSSVLGFAGKAFGFSNGCIWMWEYPLTFIDANNQTRSQPAHWWCIAHEIGHFICNTSHSNLWLFGDNISYIPGTDPERRLMTGRSGPKRATNPPYLIKPEWDRIRLFFENGPREE